MPRTARSVSDVLRKAGIPVGYRYTPFGYEKNGVKVTEPGCEVTRMHRSRYSGMEDQGHVSVYLIDPEGRDVGDDFRNRVEAALTAAGLPTKRAGSLAIDVLDDQEHDQ